VLHETFTVPMGIGFALVILGSTLATRPSQGPQPVEPAAAEAVFRHAAGTGGGGTG